MSIVVGNVPLHLWDGGSGTGIDYDNSFLYSITPSQIVARFTKNGATVMDATVNGNINITGNNISGRITSLTATQPSGNILLSISNANLSFSNAYDFSNVLTVPSMLSGDDQIFGSSQTDYLQGYAGNDYISGGGGDDQIYTSPGFDTIDGGEGIDTVINLQYTSTARLIAFNGQVAILDRSNGSDVLMNVEYVRYYDGMVPTSSAAGFDALGYLAANRDLAAVFGTNQAAAFTHYIRSGYTESRATSFDAAGYLAANADLAAAFGVDTVTATRHYITNGRLEGRKTSFDATSYLAANPDLIQAFGSSTTAAALHYATTGRLEGRTTTFNAAAYLARNPDLQRRFGNSEASAAAHYVNFGYREGRSTTPLATTGRAAPVFGSDPSAGMLAATV
ncbi:hypothetical protein [Azospirillum sp. TSH64]|uniref:calcium-binding protein n=1 Tax=Azospirillum sp. TSH64 TaxID=652740 RepID=UPI000D69391E|nr:hypothetical protein [Azospirillum sp. TSH64]